MPRAQGSNIVSNFAFESTYGTVPASGSNWYKAPIKSTDLGAVQNLIEDDTLGLGRDARAPISDVINNTGKLSVPVDLRNIGLWLKLLLGTPTTSTGQAATGSYTFSAQPAVNSTITIGSVAVTFVASGATGNQVNLGASVTATVTALAVMLNAVATGALSTQTYTATGAVLGITSKTAGTSGNAITLAAQAASNASVSASTLLGGSNQFVFSTGALLLPSSTIEIGFPDLTVPVWDQHFGACADKLALKWARSGLPTADIDIIAQSTNTTSASAAGSSQTTLALKRFAQLSGYFKVNGVAANNVIENSFDYSNGLQAADVIRADGLIAGADPGMTMLSGTAKVRFDDDATLRTLSVTQQSAVINMGWSLGNGTSIDFQLPATYLPKAKRGVSGPNGIELTLPYKAGGASGADMIVTLNNDVASY